MVVLKRVVVTGAAGYIGANVCIQLLDLGYDVVGVDRDWPALSRLNIPTKYGYDVCSANLDEVFWRAGKVDACIHLAADISVPESVQKPLEYYYNNTYGSLNVLQSCVRHKVPQFILSSTAAVYGGGTGNCSRETDQLSPINPYGKSKQMVETMLCDAMIASGIRGCALRYFNVVGNDPLQRVKDAKWKIKTNLFPTCMRAITGEIPEVLVYGKDYFTEDGTAQRDYIHVSDLARAHIVAMEQGLVGAFNLGTGNCYSVLQVLNEFSKHSDKLKWRFVDRRLGDPPKLLACTDKISLATGWKPQYKLTDMVVDYIKMIEVQNEQTTEA